MSAYKQEDSRWRLSMAREDWLLMALASRNGEPMDPVQVQKSMFLLSKELVEDVGPDFYSFQPYNYGPFDARIYGDLQRLAIRGLISITNDWGPRRFSITPAGMQRGNELLTQLRPTARSYLARVVGWVCSLSFATLVRSIYAKYPEYRRNSVFAG
jgi:uncharacterized protein